MDDVKALIVGTITGIVFFLGGYLLTQVGWNEFGTVLFVLVPLVAGFAMAVVVPDMRILIASLMLSLLISGLVLGFSGLEGLICVAMAFPLMLGTVALGAWLGRHFRRGYDGRPDQSTTARILLFVMGAAAITGFGGLEKSYTSGMVKETITTRILLPVQPEVAWRLVERMNTLDGEQPFLLRAGLPVPRKCTLDSGAVGGRRICYFDNGYIDQTVTRWDFPNVMTVKVTGSTLPGPTWLSFVDAGYTFRPVSGGTEVIRTSTVASRLRPRWYWRTLEHLGVEAEHEYVLGNVARWASERVEF